MRKDSAIPVALVGFLLFAGCENAPPAAPTPHPGPQQPNPGPASIAANVQVTVYDGALRPVQGATIEIEDGNHQKTSRTTNAEGRAGFDGSWINPLTIRTSREGFVSSSQLQWVTSGEVRIEVRLPATDQVQLRPGDYSLTFVMDSACSSGIPESLRTLRYDATVEPLRSASGAVFGYSVTAHGPTLEFGNVFFGVSGGGFVQAYDDMGFWEYLPSFTYLDFSGVGETTLDNLTPDTISMPYSAVFEYCRLNSPRDRFKNCFMTPASQIVARVTCSSLNHRIVLSRH
jgi:hypothetical protein